MSKTEDRKKDHIDMSFESVPDHQISMQHMYYEPLLNPHPTDSDQTKKTFLGYEFGMPLWISSMTGGTEKAFKINQNLARACAEFNLGMGLGSCRPLLESDERIKDFDVKHIMGSSPLFANFGIAQLEELIAENKLDKITKVIQTLSTDGLIIHVNPLQEWAQKEGDRYKRPALETIEIICEKISVPIIVKEVGQGMGPRSLKALMNLPIAGIELAGFGGTNFSILERRRQQKDATVLSSPSDAFGYVGHSAEQMIGFLNTLNQAKKSNIEIIISGGVKDPVTGHILMKNLQMNSVIGMASNVLKYAMEDYDILQNYLSELKECFAMAQSFIVKS